MKKHISIFSFSLLLTAALALTASTQQEKNNKGNKEQQQNKGKGQEKTGKPGKEDNGNMGNNKNNGQSDKMDKKDNNGNKNNNGKNEKNNNNGKNEMNDNKDKNNKMNNRNNDKVDVINGYNWNRENFKERKKIKNQDKVNICHKFNRESENPVTISVSANAVKAHINHGDVMGDCPAITGNRRYSDIFLRNRTDYYNTLQNSQEQVYYSRSILDYALGRLTNSRLQLTTMQNNNMPLADIQRKEASVVELEQNVSLLETLVGVAANLVGNKFQ